MAGRGNKIGLTAALDDQVTGKLGKIRDQFDLLGKNAGVKAILQGVGVGAGISAFNALGGAVSAATDFAGDAITKASDLNETMSKSEVIFGNQAAAVADWADTMDAAAGQSKKAALDAAAGFAGLFKTVGLELDQATDMSQDLTQLGSDLASFFNTDVESALAALKSGLNGESEPLRQFNVFLSDTAVKAKAAALGLKPVNGALTEGQKATARYALILEQTTDAQGDFARTSDGLANSQRIIAAEMENLTAEIGEELLPVARDLSLWVKDEGLPAFKELIITAKELGPWIEVISQALNGGVDDGYAFARSLDDAAVAQAEYTEILKGSEAALDDFRASERDLIGTTRNLAAENATTAADFAAIRAMADKAAKEIDDYADSVRTAMQAVGDAAFGPEELQDKLDDANQSLRDANRDLKSLRDDYPNPTKRQREDIDAAERRVRAMERAVLDVHADIALLDGLTLDEIRKHFNRLGNRAGYAAEEMREVWRLALQLEGYSGPPRPNQVGGGLVPRAAGGPVWPGESYMVGEDGPETLTMMGGGGFVTPMGGGGRRGGGGGLTVVFNSTWPPTPAQAREIAQVVDRELYYELQRAPQSVNAG